MTIKFSLLIYPLIIHSVTHRQPAIAPPHVNASGTSESIFIHYHPLTHTNWQPTFPPICDVSAEEPAAYVAMAAEKIQPGNRKLGFKIFLNRIVHVAESKAEILPPITNAKVHIWELDKYLIVKS